jgi:Glycosyl hydrolases family 43
MGRKSSNRQTIVTAGLVIGVVAWIVTSRDPWQSWSRDEFWQLDRAFADPAAVYAGEEVHVYTTSATQCVPGQCTTYWVPRFASPSLEESGGLQGDAMPDLPAWVAPDRRVIWGPSVARIGSGYVMYFAATSNRAPYVGMKCLGAAVSPSPTDPFRPLPEPLRCTYGFWNIDPYAVSDGTNWFLLWREDDPAHVTGKIVAAQLRPDGLGFGGAQERTLLVGEYAWEEGYPEGTHAVQPGAAATDRRLPEGALRSPTGIGPIENPAMARHPETGEWLLTWSANRWETRDYATGLATCDGPLGPCHRLSRDDPWLHSAGDGSVATAAEFVGCGGLSFVTGPDERLYAVFHAYRGSGDASDSARVGWVYAVEADDSGYALVEFD